MSVRLLPAVLLLSATPGVLFAQSSRSLVREGNGEYTDGKFADAEVAYRKALEKEHGLTEGQFNLGNALHRQGKYDEAARAHEQVLGDTQERATQADAYFNIGNSHLKAGAYREAVDAYVESLKRNPDDQDAKYNLSYALQKLHEQQQQQQSNKNDQQKQNPKDNKDQNKQQNKQDQQQDQRQQQPQNRERQMSRADAERILEVLKNAEKDIQKRLRARQAVRPKGEKDW